MSRIIEPISQALEGIRWRIKSGESLSVTDCIVHNVCGNFQIDDGATVTIDEEGRLCVDHGTLILEGTLINEGQIILE